MMRVRMRGRYGQLGNAEEAGIPGWYRVTFDDGRVCFAMRDSFVIIAKA